MKYRRQGRRYGRDETGKDHGDSDRTERPGRPSPNESIRNVVEHGCVGYILYDHTLVGNFIGQHPVFLEFHARILR